MSVSETPRFISVNEEQNGFSVFFMCHWLGRSAPLKGTSAARLSGGPGPSPWHDGGFYLCFSPGKHRETYLCLKEPFFQVYQRRLALSAGVQVKLQMDVFTPGKMERKERENVSGCV